MSARCRDRDHAAAGNTRPATGGADHLGNLPEPEIARDSM